MSFKERFATSISIILGVSAVAALIYFAKIDSEERQQCSVSCKNLKSKMIDDVCYCKQNFGWLKSGLKLKVNCPKRRGL